jgi:hypothetical protein
MKGYATRIKQIKELAGEKDMSDETAAIILLAKQQMELGEKVLQKLSGLESGLTTLREAVKLSK